VPLLEVGKLTKQFGDTRAVDGISFSVDAGEIAVIVGGSGCGKTTTLRCIAGLEAPTSGTISLDGRVIASEQVFVPPEGRGIGMVFQSYALWPHMSVAENIAYGLRRQRMAPARRRELVENILVQVGLSGFAERYPSTLSGGQQQRVALARSVVVKPKLLLLDEPLSNLDAKLREQMRDELREMIKSFGITAVHITHDQDEAMALADQIICMRDGRIEQKGSARELYRKPVNRFVASFIGAASFVEGTIVAKGNDPHTILVRVAGDLAILAEDDGNHQIGSHTLLVIRPEAVSLCESAPSGENVFPATVMRGTFLGSTNEYIVETAGLRLKARSPLDFPPDATCFVAVDHRQVKCVAR
jgi:ABC-type Fe3+/spermidine/putrescine transport system ATPase subunit